MGERSSKIVRYDVTGAPRTEEQKERMKIKNSRERRCWARGTLRRDKGRDTCYYSTIHNGAQRGRGKKQDGAGRVHGVSLATASVFQTVEHRALCLMQLYRRWITTGIGS